MCVFVVLYGSVSLRLFLFPDALNCFNMTALKEIISQTD